MNNEHAYIGVGSNLGDSIAYLNSALTCMDAIPTTRLLATSSFYASAPLSRNDDAPPVPEQNDYTNCVCLLETGLDPFALLTALQAIENEHGRERGDDRWGARTLDLDILLYGAQTIDSPELTVPHYGMAERSFVLVPLFEIAPNLVMPNGEMIAQWVARCNLDGLRRQCQRTLDN